MDKKRGRPRNTEAKNAILNASYDLLLEMGFGAVTVEKIAELAQVSKATIYKWWPNKAAVVIDGYLFAASARLPIPDSGSVKEDLVIHAGNLAMFLSSREGKVITELIGQGQFDPGLAEAYRSRFFGPRRQEAWQLLERGVARGELKQELDIWSSIDLIYGPIFYRLLLTGDALNEESVRNLVLLALEGIQA
ncbi:TetR/AcrR family transcriptional regulator [Paenibacillus sp. FSL R7-0297]|uniref:TetR/AcrR family transcriptional regulator n=1 Tax=unclassified Paenibacillus TaxID=185978 RepID=UPI0004F5BAA2|nr:TetR/AcrR family transcriptional regulator [Paenibacillus sp. FSL R5-0912]AIQ39626.1 TetR family transcriptional regulator [Paenibacillus sp. FSL R5-0912]